MITYNGNEMMLQNDMGNTRIQDSATGNIMSLSPGFIPVGMKEHGGIIYIASVNKDGQGEIGTIPSPIIRDIYKAKISIPFYDTIIPVDTGDPIQITNKLYPADKFIANLQMTIDPNNLKGILHTKKSGLSVQDKDPCDIVLERQICNTITSDGRIYSNSLYSPVISYSTNSEDNVYIDELEYPRFIRKKGIYKLNLYSSPEEGKSVIASDNLLSSQVYGPDGENKSQYWFLHTDYPTTVFPKDLFNATLNKDLKQVPVSNKPGKLAIELIPESITDFGMLPREDELHVPITYKTKDVEYHTYFPGFYYTSDNGLYVEKLTARVIDESTNLEVDLVYPYDKEVLFDRFDLSGITYESSQDDNYENPFCNGGLKLWNLHGRFGLPHQRSNQSSNTQILSPIAGLFNHKQTSFKSSTQDKDDSPHSGVFYANLGDKYQNWYRLEVNYEDQYGGNKGTFTTRFNPYINDVFGTNLSVNGIELAEAYIMGKQINTKEQNLQSEECEYVITYTSKDKYTDTDYVGNDPNTDSADTDLSGSQRNAIKNKTCLKFKSDNYPEYTEFTYSPTTKKSVILSFYAGKPKSELTSNTYFYLYTNIQQKLRCQFEKTDDPRFSIYSNTSPATKYRLWYAMYNLNSGNTPDWTNDWNVTGQHTFTSERIYLKYGSTVQELNYHIDWSNKDESYTRYPYFQSSCKTNLMDPSFEQVIDMASLKEDGSFDFSTIRHEDLSFYFSQIENMNGGFDRDWAAMLYTIPKSDSHKRLNLQFKTKGTKTLTLLSSTFMPAYYITPYFCLTGINNSETIYIQRFGKLQDECAVYEHNFESDKGLAINYISDPNSYTYAKSTPCSYNEQEQTPFEYLQGDVSLTSSTGTLDPGIYVLNIQRCPGVGNWTQSKNGHLINLQINIGNASYNVENWSTDVLDTNGYKYKTSNGETSNMRIYTPIVLVIPNNSSFGIKIESVSDDGSVFTRQNLGLYKIREVGQDEILKELDLQAEPVYLYHDYMKLIQDKSANLDTVEQYAFIQKYGVFFKEAFVFVDGLYKDNQINHITIGTKTYQPYPYIPSDPSILPVNLGENYNYYWNTYYMPEEVLTSDDCEFIFSNESGLSHIIDTNKFKSIQSGKLRQLINQ